MRRTLPWIVVLPAVGSGRTSRLLEPRGGEVTTLELNPVLVEVVRTTQGHDGRIEVGDGRAL